MKLTFFYLFAFCFYALVAIDPKLYLNTCDMAYNKHQICLHKGLWKPFDEDTMFLYQPSSRNSSEICLKTNVLLDAHHIGKIIHKQQCAFVFFSALYCLKVLKNTIKLDGLQIKSIFEKNGDFCIKV